MNRRMIPRPPKPRCSTANPPAIFPGALDQLPADMRTVLILYALEKQRYEDIAQITGVSVGTVKSRLNRARQKLAAILANQREQNEKSSVLPSERRTGK